MLESRRLAEEVLGSTKKSEKIVARNRSHLEELIEEAKRTQGPNCDLNHIDVSRITDMSFLFYESDFNGDISKWDVSNVKNMSFMFHIAQSFNQPIGNWDVSNVTDMTAMFFAAISFNQDISKWDVSKVEVMRGMFTNSPLSNNPPAWYKEQVIFSPF